MDMDMYYAKAYTKINCFIIEPMNEKKNRKTYS